MPLPHRKPLSVRVDDLVRALRSRHLDQVAVSYALIGWVVVQGVSIVVPTFGADNQLVRATIIFLLIGFPLTLIAVWFAAPHIGMAQSHKRLSKTAYAVFLASALVSVAVAADVSLMLARMEPSHSAPAATANLALSRNSIAVLPFANMSGDPQKEYLSDGIADELLDELAAKPQLQVAARTSSFAFKNKNESIREIARALSVRSVLEGSVRESGQHLRISGELIDADSGHRLWSATFDRDLTDILMVEEDIARAIGGALTKQLLPPGHPQPAVSRISADAYRAYLMGKRDLEPRTTSGTEAAISLFQKTVSEAPQFADGFAALADAEVVLADKLPGRNDLIPAAQAALEQALKLDPHNIEALSSRLDLSLHRLDWPRAASDARALNRVAPKSAKVLHEMFRFYEFMSFPDLALAAATRAAYLDPLSFVDRFNISIFLLHDARFPEAIAASNAALVLRPHHPIALAVLCVAAANAGQIALAHDAEKQLVSSEAKAGTQSADDTSSPLCRFAIAIAEHRSGDAKRIIDQLAQTFPQSGMSAFELGEKYAIAEDFKKAGFWFDRSYNNKEFLLFLLPSDKIVPAAFHESPEYRGLLAEPLFRDWQAARDSLAGDLASR